MFVTVVTVLSVLGLAYFAVLGLTDPAALVPAGDAEAAKTFAGYMATRNLVLGGAALLLLARRAWPALSLVLLLSAAVQVLDAVLGLARHDVAQTAGPVVIAAALVAAVALLRRRSTSAVQPA